MQFWHLQEYSEIIKVCATKVPLLLVAWDVPEFIFCAIPLHCTVGVPLLVRSMTIQL
jgi:hypothetical protein